MGGSAAISSCTYILEDFSSCHWNTETATLAALLLHLDLLLPPLFWLIKSRVRCHLRFEAKWSKTERNFVLLDAKKCFICLFSHRCKTYSRNLKPLFLLAWTFSKFLQNLFEKRQVAPSRFSKEFCVNPRKALTNKKRGIALFCLQKSLVNPKAFGVKRARIYKFSIILKGEFKK